MAKSIIIIGGGPAGIEAAKVAATAEKRVTLISEEPVGGRAGWHSLLPSKVWLAAADAVGVLAGSPFLTGSAPQTDPAAILTEIQSIKSRWSQQQVEDLNALSIEVLQGVASFESTDRIVIKDGAGQVLDQRQADATIIATGSIPFFPPNLRPDGRWVLAPRFVSQLDRLPRSMIVIGAGATGCEFVYLFNRLGVNVTWIIDQYGVLPAFDLEAGQRLAEIMEHRGVTLVRGQLADRVVAKGGQVQVITTDEKHYQAEKAFVAIGRVPDLSRLNLTAVGLPVETGKALPVNGFGQTASPNIYAVGDATGAPMLANRAMAQARIAGQHAAGVDTLPFYPETTIHAIYTDPQVAQVGTITGDHVQTVRVPFASGLKAHLLSDGEGFVKVAYTQDRCVAGGVAVGPHAADVLTPIALAIQVDASLDDLTTVYAAHPTVSELVFIAARRV